MKVVILAGGFGTRISEESQYKPKPMIEIGGMPILWHIMKSFSAQGFNEFVICAGYKQDYIKRWFANYMLANNDVCFDVKNNKYSILSNNAEPWKVTVVDTGLLTQTGGRIKRILQYVDDEFVLTYGDGLSDIDINNVINIHNNQKAIITISAYSFSQNKGVIEMNGNYVTEFREKSNSDDSLINIGYMVINKKIGEYIDGDDSILERDTMNKLIKENKVQAYIHRGYWQCMDTLREKNNIEKLWDSGKAPWKKW